MPFKTNKTTYQPYNYGKSYGAVRIWGHVNAHSIICTYNLGSSSVYIFLRFRFGENYQVSWCLCLLRSFVLRTMTRADRSTNRTNRSKRAGVTFHVTRVFARAFPAPRAFTCGVRLSTTSIYATPTKCAGAWISSLARPNSAWLVEVTTLTTRAHALTGSTS